MDKIAIISDIHGNITALKAVLQDIKRREISRIFCLGDIIGKGPLPEVAVDIIKNTCEKVVKGNWDAFITEDKCFNIEIGQWITNKLGSDRLDYLMKLPLYIEFYMSGKLIRLFHATAEDVYKRIQMSASVEEKLSMFMAPVLKEDSINKNSDVVGYGDIHNAYVQYFREKILFNVGSVGNPLDIKQASYAVLEGIFDKREEDSLSVNIVRVPYDIEKAIEEAKNENMPELTEYIDELRSGRYRGLSKK
jgi:predicted phosphodiesterase